MSRASIGQTFVLRDADGADFDRVAPIYGHHVRTGFGTFDEVAPDAARMRQRFVEVTGLGLPYLVAAEGAAILGYAYASPYRPRSAYRFTVEDSVYVAAELEHRGIGTALLETLATRCAAAGMRQLIAVIGDSGNDASIGLHVKCGFHHVGILRGVGFKRGRSVDTVIMQRAL